MIEDRHRSARCQPDSRTEAGPSGNLACVGGANFVHLCVLNREKANRPIGVHVVARGDGPLFFRISFSLRRHPPVGPVRSVSRTLEDGLEMKPLASPQSADPAIRLEKRRCPIFANRTWFPPSRSCLPRPFFRQVERAGLDKLSVED